MSNKRILGIAIVTGALWLTAGPASLATPASRGATVIPNTADLVDVLDEVGARGGGGRGGGARGGGGFRGGGGGGMIGGGGRQFSGGGMMGGQHFAKAGGGMAGMAAGMSGAGKQAAAKGGMGKQAAAKGGMGKQAAGKGGKGGKAGGMGKTSPERAARLEEKTSPERERAVPLAAAAPWVRAATRSGRGPTGPTTARLSAGSRSAPSSPRPPTAWSRQHRRTGCAGSGPTKISCKATGTTADAVARVGGSAAHLSTASVR